MYKLEEVKNSIVDSKSPILMVRPKKAILTTEGSKAVLEVHIDDKCYAATNGKERREMETRSKELQDELEERLYEFKKTGETTELTAYGLNFVAGGLLYSTPECGIVIRRDERAPSYPGYFTTASGFARDIEEMLYPRLCEVREGCEEILIFGRDDTIYIPIMDFPEDKTSRRLKSKLSPNELERMVRKQAKNIGIKNVRTRRIETERILGNECLRIIYNYNTISEINNTGICIDAANGNIDIIDIFCLDINPEEVIIKDGEMDSKGNILDREIYAIRIKDLKEGRNTDKLKIQVKDSRPIYYFKGGVIHYTEEVEVSGYTPSLKHAIRLL